ncbi:hypothetical protein BDV26DRAFT_121266 [Aspergillus bertholletiae]|uniref:BTB domain-containing protein n=1 Tax=Aspergillus bertholletiae TaxID=1226010 RepID=A0A5N7APC6_9EURO|nr:hypothetical protein BDV26DRAFT_121266 [Aspergillus bertholletiae]
MAKPLMKDTLTAGIARINVGVDDTPFDVHIELLCDHSPYFDALYEERTKKSIADCAISFPDDDPDAFSVLVSWMYRGDITVDLSRANMLFGFKLWVLAGKFSMAELQNTVMAFCKARIDASNGALFCELAIDYVYSNTLPKSPLRLLVVDTWVQNATQSRFLRRKDLRREFLEDFCCALIEWKEGKTKAVDLTDTTSHYFIDTSPLKDNGGEILVRGDISEIMQPATPEQMQNRKVKRPSSRICKISPAPCLPAAMTPTSTDTGNDPSDSITSDMSSSQV